MSILLLLATSALSVSCEEASGQDARYYPLSVGAVWTYTVQQYKPKMRTSSVKWRVTASTLEGGRDVYQIWPSPAQSDDEAMRLVSTAAGVLEATDNVIILRFPIKVGDTWSQTPIGSKAARKFLVRLANQPCTVNNRRISACVVIEETDAATGLRTLTTYGRDVGPVKYEYFRQQSGKDSLVQSVSLSGYKTASNK